MSMKDQIFETVSDALFDVYDPNDNELVFDPEFRKDWHTVQALTARVVEELEANGWL